MSVPVRTEEWLNAATRGSLADLKSWKKDGRLEPGAFGRLVSICNERKSNALQIAIEYGNEDYTRALLNLGRWPDSMNSEKHTALSLAVKCNTPEMVQALIDIGHSTRQRPRQERSLMDEACRAGAVKAGLVLLANGVNDVSYEALCDLVYITARRCLTIGQDGAQVYPKAEIELLDGLFASGVNPNWVGKEAPEKTCLERWCDVVEDAELANEFHVKILHVLLKHGADTEQKVDMGIGGLVLPGALLTNRDCGLQDLMRRHKALVCQQVMDGSVNQPAAASAAPVRRI